MKITDLPNNDPTWVVPAGDYADQRQRAELVALRASLATAEDANRRNLGLLEVVEQQGVELEAMKQRLATAEARFYAANKALGEQMIRANEAAAERDDAVSQIPTDAPDRNGKLILNAYGRRCYEAGIESVGANGRHPDA